jgi:predicted dehydrogenase
MTVNATSSGMRPIRVGLIGAGHWAHHGHLPVLTLLPEYVERRTRPEQILSAAPQ